MPSYGFEARYEDNIYRVPADENGAAVAIGGVRGSWIFANGLGLKLSAPVAENQKGDGLYRHLRELRLSRGQQRLQPESRCRVRVHGVQDEGAGL